MPTQMEPGDRVRSREDGRRGTIEWVSGFGTLCNVVWDDQTTSAIKVRALAEEPCPKIDNCPILRSFRDRDVPEGIYEEWVRKMCVKCRKEEA